jgi:hypothetical protein
LFKFSGFIFAGALGFFSIVVLVHYLCCKREDGVASAMFTTAHRGSNKLTMSNNRNSNYRLTVDNMHNALLEKLPPPPQPPLPTKIPTSCIGYNGFSLHSTSGEEDDSSSVYADPDLSDSQHPLLLMPDIVGNNNNSPLHYAASGMIQLENFGETYIG